LISGWATKNIEGRNAHLGNSDDRSGGFFMGILITFGSVVVATVAAMFERILRNALEMKSENDFTV
jgi:hypothetical protein